jgi:2-keto-3-deoxy-galactonokinase
MVYPVPGTISKWVSVEEDEYLNCKNLSTTRFSSDI